MVFVCLYEHEFVSTYIKCMNVLMNTHEVGKEDSSYLYHFLPHFFEIEALVDLEACCLG